MAVTDDPGPGADPDQSLHIHQASEMLGVPAPTLRSWERRYGLPVTLRSAGGHRRYDSGALTQLGRMRDEITTGRRPADAARRVLAAVGVESAHYLRASGVLDAATARDASSLRAILDESRRDLGLAATLDEVVMPAMRLVGTWWETGRCDIGDEEFATDIVRGWLAKTTTLATPRSHRWVLLATGPADFHTVGLEALAALLATQGIASRLQGARTPADVLVAAAVKPGAAAAVVVSHLPTQRRLALASITAVAATGCATFYAGNAFLFDSNRVGVPGTYLGESLTGAARIIGEALPRESPPAPLAAAG